VPGPQLLGLIRSRSGSDTISADELGQMVMEGVIGYDAAGRVQVDLGNSVVDQAMRLAGGDGQLGEDEVLAGYAKYGYPNAVGTEQLGAAFGLLLVVLGLPAMPGMPGKTLLSEGDTTLDESQIEQLVSSGVLRRDEAGALVIDTAQLHRLTGAAFVSRYGAGPGAVDDNGSLASHEFRDALDQWGAGCGDATLNVLFGMYAQHGLVGPEDIARMLDKGLLVAQPDGSLRVDEPAVIAEAASNAYRSAGNVHHEPVARLQKVLKDLGIACSDDAAARLASRYISAGGYLDTARMFADGVLVPDPVTGVVTVNLNAMPLVPGDIILAAGYGFDDEFNRVALSEMLNATGAHYAKEDLDGLIGYYRSNPTGDVITLASIEQMIADGVLRKDPVTGVVTVDWAAIPIERIAQSLVLDSGSTDGMLNRRELANALNSTGSDYWREQVEGLIDRYGNGDVVTQADIERMLADRALTRGESGQVEVDPTLLSESEGRGFVADAIDFL